MQRIVPSLREKTGFLQRWNSMSVLCREFFKRFASCFYGVIVPGYDSFRDKTIFWPGGMGWSSTDVAFQVSRAEKNR